MKRRKITGQKDKCRHMKQIDRSVNGRNKATGKALQQMTGDDKKHQHKFCVVVSVDSVFHGANLVPQFLSLRLRRYKTYSKTPPRCKHRNLRGLPIPSCPRRNYREKSRHFLSFINVPCRATGFSVRSFPGQRDAQSVLSGSNS